MEEAQDKKAYETDVLEPHMKLAEQEKLSRKAQITLIPEPTDDPQDPLNWSFWYKSTQAGTLAFAAFSSLVLIDCNLLAYVAQAKTYHREPVELSYGSAAALAGLVVGPLLQTPVAEIIGRPSLLFWNTILQLICQIWSALMIHEDQYVSFVLSRLFAGLTGSMISMIGTSFIVDMFFLHQRGRMLMLYDLAFLFGTQFPTVIAGIIVQRYSWQWCFWWTLPVQGFSALLVFAFVRETHYDRKAKVCRRPPENMNWFSKQCATMFAGWRFIPKPTRRSMFQPTKNIFMILTSPIVLAPGLFCFFTFGFTIMIVFLMSIYLQTPEAAGGYGFSPLQNAYFSFVNWVSVLAAWGLGHLLADRLPLMVAKRIGHGTWQPEYRLVNMIVPCLLSPIGLGLLGASLQYHLHYMLVAFAFFLQSVAAYISIPICINYIVECYIDCPTEVTVAFNLWRVPLGIALPFAAEPWAARVGPGWQFGTAAFLVLATGITVLSFGCFGGRLRAMNVMQGRWKVHTEGGQKVMH